MSYWSFLLIFSIVGSLTFWFLFQIFNWLFSRWDISKKNSLKLATIAFLGVVAFFLYIPSDEIRESSYLEYSSCKPDGFKGSLLARYYPSKFWQEEKAALGEKIRRTEFSLPLSFDAPTLEKEISLLDQTLQKIKETKAEEAVRQFEQYMRTLDETKAPLLFEQKINDPQNPFSSILTFAQGYKELIIADNKRLETMTADRGKWVLDLATPSLWSHLNHWGQQKRPLEVTCDESKPLKSIISRFSGNEKDPGIVRAKEILGMDVELGWKFARPVKFGDSRDHPALQLADMVAGTTISILGKGLSNKTMENIAKSIDKNGLRDSIMPDFELVDPSKKEAGVNALILYELSRRALVGQDPHFRIDEWYDMAEATWAHSNFKKPGEKLS